jgi:Protein of unknown function (DUF2510)
VPLPEVRAAFLGRLQQPYWPLAERLLDLLDEQLQPGEELRELWHASHHGSPSAEPLHVGLLLMAFTDQRIVFAREDDGLAIPPTTWAVGYGQVPVRVAPRFTATGPAIDGSAVVAWRRRVAPTKAFLAVPPPTAAWIQQAETRAGAPPAGWNADPMGRHELRYWDGRAWTADVSDQGVQAVDPLD